MTSFLELQKQINERGYAAVPFPILKSQFQETMDIFFAFLTLPQADKEKTYFRVIEGNRGSEVGYMRYRREEGKTDNREYFHYHRLAEERFKEARQGIPQLDALLTSMKYIHDEAVGTLKEVILRFEEEFPGIYEKFFSEEKPGNFYLRVLKYDYSKPGEFLAKGHYDRGTCTLALAESAPGLRMGRDDEHVQEVQHTEGETLFMPGLKFADVTAERFVPTWHDVVQRGDDTYNDEIARWAVVFFADAFDLPDISYEEAHSPKR